MSLGENIKNARNNIKLSQVQLADNLTKKMNSLGFKDFKIGNTTISNWEKGISKPDIDVIFALCEILNVDANYMLDFEKRKKEFETEEQRKKILMEKGFMDKDGNISAEAFDKLVDIANKIKNN